MSASGQPTRSLLDRRTFNDLLLVVSFAALLAASILLAGGAVVAATVLLIFGLPAFAFVAVALRWNRPWSYLAAAIAISIFPLLTLAFGASAFLNPQDAPTFAGAVLALLAIALGLPGGVQAFRRKRRGIAQPTAREGLLTRRGFVAVGIVALSLGAIVTSGLAYARALSGASVGTGYDFVPGASVSLVARDFVFRPSNFAVASGTITEIVIANEDPTFHTFTYVDPGSGRVRSHDILSASTTRFLVFFSAPEPQPVRFWCMPHEYAGMAGTFTIS